MKTKTLTIEFNGQPAEVIIKRLTFGERAKLRKSVRTIKYVNNVQNIEIDEEKLLINTLKFGLLKAPFEITDESIKQLDGNTGEFLYQEIDKFNTLDDGKTLNSEGSKTPEGKERHEDRTFSKSGHTGDNDVLHDG